MVRKILNSFALAFDNIRSNLFHTFLSVLGIVIGVAALVSILSLIDGMEKFAREQISTTTSLNGIIIQSEAYKRVNEVRLRKDTLSVIDYNQFQKLSASLSKSVTSYIRSTASGEAVLSSSGVRVGVNMIATSSSLEPGVKGPSGDFFTESHIKEMKPYSVVNKAFIKASQFKTEEEAIGKEVVFRNKKLTIVAILPEGKETPQVYYPISLLSEQELQASPPEVFFDAQKTEDVAVLKEEMITWLKGNYANAKSDFRIITNDFRIQQATKGFLLFRVIMGLIVGISVMVGGIGVMNVLLISVTERTAEIGIRKATGANRRDIVLLFLAESITVSAFGSLLGLILGVVGTMIIIPIVKAITEVPFQAAYTWNTFVIISIISILVGVIFGTYPAIRASRLDPVEAIRHE
jgi:putative ABC transport system permease protein